MEERRVERETVVEAEPERVWEALTDDGLLSDWFADDAELDPVEGGDVSFGFGDDARRGTVRSVDELRELSFTWSRPGEDESLVTFQLEPLEVGTRVVVVEGGTGAGRDHRALGVGLGRGDHPPAPLPRLPPPRLKGSGTS